MVGSGAPQLGAMAADADSLVANLWEEFQQRPGAQKAVEDAQLLQDAKRQAMRGLSARRAHGTDTVMAKQQLYTMGLKTYSKIVNALNIWKKEKQLTNEPKELQDYHLACLKEQAQCALKLGLFETALEAADAATTLRREDHKAWEKKVQAEKGLGRLEEAEDSLLQLKALKPARLQVGVAEHKRIQPGQAESQREATGAPCNAAEVATGHLGEEEARQYEQPRVPEEPWRAKVQEDGDSACMQQEPRQQGMRSVAAHAGNPGPSPRPSSPDSGGARSSARAALAGSGCSPAVAIGPLRALPTPCRDAPYSRGSQEIGAAIRCHADKEKAVSEELKHEQVMCPELLHSGTALGR